jgi:very-short-patch-repair endonuclease
MTMGGNGMGFEEVYALFMINQLKTRKGEAKRRLKEGHGHAEKLFLELVWWPIFRHFDYLFPEFEVRDFQDGYRYLDFAFIYLSFRVCFEIDGFGPHSRDMNRRQFADQLLRQNHLVLDGWIVFRFSYDDIRDRPRQCQQIILQMMGRWFGDAKDELNLTVHEKEIVRLAKRTIKPITPITVSQHLGICRRNAQKQLHQLVEKQVLIPEQSGNGIRIRAYRLKTSKLESFI